MINIIGHVITVELPEMTLTVLGSAVVQADRSLQIVLPNLDSAAEWSAVLSAITEWLSEIQRNAIIQWLPPN